MRIYVNKIEYRIIFKIKTGYCHEPLTRETMKLLGSTKSNNNKNKNGTDVPHLEINEVVLVIVQESCIHFSLKIFWLIIWYFTQKSYVFKNL